MRLDSEAMPVRIAFLRSAGLQASPRGLKIRCYLSQKMVLGLD